LQCSERGAGIVEKHAVEVLQPLPSTRISVGAAQ
jgi:hypothetical protein